MIESQQLNLRLTGEMNTSKSFVHLQILMVENYLLVLTIGQNLNKPEI